MMKFRMAWAPLLLATTAMVIMPVEVSAGDRKEKREKAQQERQLDRRAAARQRQARAPRGVERNAPRGRQQPVVIPREGVRPPNVRTQSVAPVRGAETRPHDRRRPRVQTDRSRPVTEQNRHSRYTGHVNERRQVRDTRERGNRTRFTAPDARDVARQGGTHKGRDIRQNDTRTRHGNQTRERRDYDRRENYRDRNHQRRGDWWRGTDRGRHGYTYRNGKYWSNYNRGYWNGYRRGFRSSWWYGVPSYTSFYYFGHWPYYSGFWHARSHWLWHGHHHHYHYGDYCPGFDYHYDTHYSASVHYGGSGGNVAGIILGGVIGGILGSEIDGGRDRSAGIVIGSLVGAAIGNAATSGTSYTASSHDYSYSDVGYDDRDSGRYHLEDETYSPPREIRTCIEYTYRQGDYVCRKWEVEYDYDD